MAQTVKDRRDLAADKARRQQELAREELRKVQDEAVAASDAELARVAEEASQVEWTRLSGSVHGRIAAHLIAAAIDAALPEAHYVSSGEAAQALGVSINTLKKWVRLGLIRDAHRTAGGHLRIAESDVARVAELNRLLLDAPDLRPMPSVRPATPWSR
jgi:excisionase family DNA binding protein